MPTPDAIVENARGAKAAADKALNTPPPYYVAAPGKPSQPPPQEPKATPEPAPTPSPEATPTPGVAPPTPWEQRQAVEQRFQPKQPFEFKPWATADVPTAQTEFKALVGEWDSTPMVAKPQGDVQTRMDAYTNIYLALKNTQSFLDQVHSYDPQSVLDLAKGPTGDGIAALNPKRSVINAVNSIAEERPNDFTAYIATDAGLQDLGQRSFIGSLTPQQMQDSNFLKDFYNFYSTPGRAASGFIRSNLPAGPLTNILAGTVDTLGDPIFVGSMFIPGLAPAGLAAKARFAFEIAGGVAATQEANRAAGSPVPSWAAGLAGGVFGVGSSALLRSGLRNVLTRAAIAPVEGEVGTALLRDGGLLPKDLSEIQDAVIPNAVQNLPKRVLTDIERGPDIVYSGQGPLRAEEIAAGQRTKEIWVTPQPEDVANTGEPGSQVMAFQVRPGAEPVIQADYKGALAYKPADLTPVSRMPLEEVYDQETIALARPITEGGVTAPPGAVLEAGAEGTTQPLPAMAGGGPKPFGMEVHDQMIRANFTRKEANDLLRKLAVGLSDIIPGGERLVEPINRMALIENPVKRAGVASMGLDATFQNAQREEAMLWFRGQPVPFRENNLAQVWLPEKLGSKTGAWVAGGDVMEAIQAKDPAILARLTPEQAAWALRADAVRTAFTRETEQVTGQQIIKPGKPNYWPRFVQDSTVGRFRVGFKAGVKTPPAMYMRAFESQEAAIAKYGMSYRPGLLNQMNDSIKAMQELSRAHILGQDLERSGVLETAGKPTLEKGAASAISPTIQGVMNKAQMRDLLTIIGPGTTNPMITVPAKVNAVFRTLLTGTMDNGAGAIQLMALPFSPAGPKAWATAMAHSFYNMIVDPTEIYRWLYRNPSTRSFAEHGGDLALGTEFTEALHAATSSLLHIPVVSKALGVLSYPIRFGIRRVGAAFETSITMGRVLMYDGMEDAIRAPSLLERAAGARPLAGEALDDELFRAARFADTLIGQPQLAGVIPTSQHQFESAWVWFATRYTRSFLGTLSYLPGKGATPAIARVIMAKMLLGGMAITSGLIAGIGALQGKSQEQIKEEIATALNPASGKKFMSMNINGSWYGMGGVYRSGFATFGSMANKNNWKFDSWEAGVWNNPIVRAWRTRTTPLTRLLSDVVSGQTLTGFQSDLGRFVDDPMQLGQYAMTNFAPITLGAYLQGGYGNDVAGGGWKGNVGRAFAEFLGLRTSPQTANELLVLTRNHMSQQLYGKSYDDLVKEENQVATQHVNDTPEVVAVMEGAVIPNQEQKVQTSWDKYLTQAEDIRTDYQTKKDALDTALGSGGMDGKTYRDRYSTLQQQEFAEISRAQKAVGVEFTDKVAKEGTVNAALAAYFAVTVEKFTNPITQEVDWDGFMAERDAALAGLSTTDRADVAWYLTRHESETHRDFVEKQQAIIDPSGYFQVREKVAAAIGVNLEDLKKKIVQQLQAAGRRASTTDVLDVVDKVLNQLMPTGGKLDDIRAALRTAIPRLDVELYRQGYTTTVRTDAAQALSESLGRQYPEMGYTKPPKAQQ